MSMWPFGRENMINVRDLQGEFDRLVDRLYHGGLNTAPLDGQDWAPPVDVMDESDRFVLSAEVPGLSPADVDVSVVGRSVTISGNKPSPRKPGDEQRALRAERRYGKFKRTIELSEAVDETRVHAACAHGILTVSLPKQVVVQGRRVPVEPAE